MYVCMSIHLNNVRRPDRICSIFDQARVYVTLSLSCFGRIFLGLFSTFFFFPIYILCAYLHWIHRWFEGKNTETKKKKIVEHRRSTDVNLCLWMSRSVLRLNVRVIYRMYVCWFSCSSQHENFIGKKANDCSLSSDLFRLW
jgi:hypothetical protein